MDMDLSRGTNGIRKMHERARRDARMTELVKKGKLPYTPAVILLGRGDAGQTAVAPPPEPPATGAWEDAPPGAPFVGHMAPVLAAGFTADGKLLTAGGGVER